MRWVAALAAFAGACSPFDRGAFHCDSNTECANGAVAGTCELGVGLCSFSDPSCPSGRRFGDSSGASANACVDATNDHPDAAIDGARGSGSGSGSIDAGPGCYGTGLLVVCPVQPLTAPLALVAGPVDTNAGSLACLPLRAPGATDVCALGGAGVKITGGGVLRATGERPLVIVSAGTLEIGAAVDVGSHRAPITGESLGAGSTRAPAACTPGASSDGDGGAGGSFGTQGAAGGISDPSGRAQTAPAAITEITAITAGCAGQPGAKGFMNAGAAGAAGASGGIVALLATGALTISATVNASGMGGGGGADGSRGAGGGGGGPGGTIVLDAPSVAVDADVFANGAAGGEGNGGNVGGGGCPGGESTAANDVAKVACPQGQNPQDTGGDSGDGATRDDAATPGANGTGTAGGFGGGGGGGGGLGAILVYAAQITGDNRLSPAPTPH